jgi:hypothetical protein
LVGAVDSLENDALGTELASVRKNDRAIFGDVFVDQDARLGMAEQSRERGFAVEKWEITHILAVMLEQVEGIEDRSVGGLTTVQLLEP